MQTRDSLKATFDSAGAKYAKEFAEKERTGNKADAWKKATDKNDQDVRDSQRAQDLTVLAGKCLDIVESPSAADDVKMKAQELADVLGGMAEALSSASDDADPA